MLVANPTTDAAKIANAKAHAKNAVNELEQAIAVAEAVEEGELREDLLVEVSILPGIVGELDGFLAELTDIEEHL